MTRPLIFVTRAIPEAGLAVLRAAGELRVGAQDGPIGRTALLKGVGDCEALVTMLTDRVDQELLVAAPRLKVVANFAAGVNNLDQDALRARGVIATNTPGVLGPATAEMAMALLLDVARGLSAGDRAVRRRDFPGWGPLYRMGRGLSGRRLGLVGFGSIGREMGRLARAFGMETVYFQRRRLPEAEESALQARWLPLEELLRTSDVVSLHCPLTPETRGLISAQALAGMKPGSLLINTARGEVVDEAALARALKDGPLAGAGLDVYEREPEVHPDLLGLENVVLAPHLGSATAEAREAMALLAAGNVVQALAGKRPPSALF